jgi:hypothetical protein
MKIYSWSWAIYGICGGVAIGLLLIPSYKSKPVAVIPSAFKVISEDQIAFNFIINIVADTYGQQFMVVRTSQGLVVQPYTVPVGVEPHKGF